MFFQPPIVLIEDPPGGGVPVVFIHQVGIVFRYTPGGPGSSRHNPQSFAFVPDLASGFPRAAINCVGIRVKPEGAKKEEKDNCVTANKVDPIMARRIERGSSSSVFLARLRGSSSSVFFFMRRTCLVVRGTGGAKAPHAKMVAESRRIEYFIISSPSAQFVGC